MKKLLSRLLLGSVLLAASAVAGARDDLPSVSHDGLDRVPSKSAQVVYKRTGTDFSQYGRVAILDCAVAFRKNWQRDQNRMQPYKVEESDMERIKTGLAALFGEVFTEELTRDGGYQMTAEAGPEVMRITPRIVDLDVYAPDTAAPARTDQYSESAGRMTLRLEIYDSVTGDLIVTISDRQEDPRLGWMEWRTRVSNRQDAERMLRRWASDLRERLDAARSRSAG